MTNERIREAIQGGQSRVHWIDSAKALAVCLVVVYHSAAGMDFLFPDPSGPASNFWAEFNTLVLPLRMPLFFLAAGLLASSAIRRGWNAVLRPRVLSLVWPYVLWTVAFACVAGFAYQPENPLGYLSARLQGLPFARLGYWFLLVLPFLFVVAKLLRRWAPTVTVVALALAVCAPWLEAYIFPSMHWLTIYGITRVARYAFWYLLGCYGYRYVRQVTSFKPVLLIAVSGTIFAALTWWGNVTGLSAQFAFALSFSGVTAMVGLSVWIAHLSAVRLASRYLAARTLPIYLSHPMIIVLIVIIARALGGAAHPDHVLATLLTPVLAAACVAISVVVYDRIKPTCAAWIFTPPAWADRPGRRPTRSRSSLGN